MSAHVARASVVPVCCSRLWMVLGRRPGVALAPPGRRIDVALFACARASRAARWRQVVAPRGGSRREPLPQQRRALVAATGAPDAGRASPRAPHFPRRRDDMSPPGDAERRLARAHRRRASCSESEKQRGYFLGPDFSWRGRPKIAEIGEVRRDLAESCGIVCVGARQSGRQISDLRPPGDVQTRLSCPSYRS